MNRQLECKDISGLIALYHYGELGADESALVSEHLRGCGRCRAELAETGRVLGAIRPETPAASESAILAEKVMTRITVRRSPLVRLAPVFAALAVILVFMSAQYTGRLNNEPSAPPAGQAVAGNSDRELFENMDVLANMDILDNMDTIEEMEEL